MCSNIKDAVEVKSLFGESLKISFRRTIRVPDNDRNSSLPPGMGNFPLYSTANYKNNLSVDMALKGGLFLPMYQREAMWIRFKSYDEFAIKIFVGGINAISGEPAIETVATRLRRLNLLLWLDGIASTEGRVRQFVAMPMGSGYTVEAQVTGEDVTGGLHFEITLAKFLDSVARHTVHKVFVKTLIGKNIPLSGLLALTIVRQVKNMIQKKEGIYPDMQRFIHSGLQLSEDSYSLSDYNIPNRVEIHLVLRLRGGGPLEKREKTELGVAAGGYIKQCILRDTNPASIWQRDRTICFNVQILNSAAFRKITGLAPPKSPISAATYASYGLPFFEIYNEKSDIKGDFEDVKSVKAIDKIKAKGGKKRAYCIDDDDEPAYKISTMIRNPKRVKLGFRPVSELESELSSMNAARF